MARRPGEPRVTLSSWESILWWAWSTYTRRRIASERMLARVPHRVVRLRSRAEVDAGLAGAAPVWRAG